MDVPQTRGVTGSDSERCMLRWSSSGRRDRYSGPGRAPRATMSRFGDAPRQAIPPIDPDAPVLILGTGLTMVDVVLFLENQGHRGPILALSRRRLLPTTHLETRPFKSFAHPQTMPGTVLDMLIALKADVRRAREEGLDWRAAFDATGALASTSRRRGC